MSRYAVFTVMMLWAAAAPGRADEAAIIADIGEFIRTDDTARRTELVARIQADPAYDRARVSEWLHAAEVFEPLKPGPLELAVPLPDGSTRTVVLRIPQDYDCHRAWPVIYALHGMSGHATNSLAYFQRALGADVEQYVLAAPDGYADQVISETQWPPTGEHPAALLKIKQTVNVDSDRVYVAGYSMGGHTSWTLAVLYADQFAGAVPLAGTFTIILPDHLHETFLPNLAHLPVLGVWGAGDTKDARGDESRGGGIAGSNRGLRELGAKLGLQLTMIELSDRGHSDVDPPADALRALLAQRRVPYPRAVHHVFRHLCQGSAYWLEAHAWSGEQWTDQKKTVHLREGENLFKDEDLDAAVARHYRGMLAELSGEIDGQNIRVLHKKVSDLTVWIGDGLIDWDQPVSLKAGGRPPVELQVQPDLYVCLAQAARTRDFDRLRWAGIRVRPSAGKPYLVTSKTTFPAPFSKPREAAPAKDKPKTRAGPKKG